MGVWISEVKSTLGNENYCLYTNECLASTAEILRPKKKQKVDDLSTITLGYIKNKSSKNQDEKHRLRVLFDSGCSATLINRSVLKNWKKTKGKTIKWSTKSGKFKTDRVCDRVYTPSIP